MRRCGSQGRSGRFWRREYLLLLPGFEPLAFQPLLNLSTFPCLINVNAIFPDVITIININKSCQAVIGQFFWPFCCNIYQNSNTPWGEQFITPAQTISWGNNLCGLFETLYALQGKAPSIFYPSAYYWSKPRTAIGSITLSSPTYHSLTEMRSPNNLLIIHPENDNCNSIRNITYLSLCGLIPKAVPTHLFL